MPKAFAPEEKTAIRSALMVAALKRFTRQGVRATRIDDICADVGIAKGSFYAFFPSKEELFLHFVEAREAGHRADMLAFIDTAAGDATGRLGAFFDMLIAKIENDPVLALVTRHGEIAHITRKVGTERMAKNADSDREFVAEAALRWPDGGLSAADLLGLMTLMLTLGVSRASMTTDQYADTRALLRELFVQRLVGGTS